MKQINTISVINKQINNNIQGVAGVNEQVLKAC